MKQGAARWGVGRAMADAPQAEGVGAAEDGGNAVGAAGRRVVAAGAPHVGGRHRLYERRLREGHLCRNPQLLLVQQPVGEQHDGGRVAAKRAPSKGVDDEERRSRRRRPGGGRGGGHPARGRRSKKLFI